MTAGALIGTMALIWRVLSPVQSTYLSLPRIEQAMQTFKQIDRLIKIAAKEMLTQTIPSFAISMGRFRRSVWHFAMLSGPRRYFVTSNLISSLVKWWRLPARAASAKRHC